MLHDVAFPGWNEMSKLTDPNELWLKWKCLFLSIVDEQCPSRTMRIRTCSSP